MGPKPKATPGGAWRVRIYKLREDGQWDDQGTGYIFPKTDQNVRWNICVFDEEDNSILLNTPVVAFDVYARQGETIISWLENDNSTELALSFQQARGCTEIWESITATQKALGGPKPDESHSNTSCDTEVAAEDQDMAYTAAFSTSVQLHELTLDSEVLEAAVNQIRVYAETAREKLVFQLKKKQWAYLADFFRVFHEAEEKHSKFCLPYLFRIGREFRSLYEVLVTDRFFFDLVGTQEYDPGMEYRPRHRDFLKSGVNFRQAIPLPSEAVETWVHTAFRLTFLRDVLVPRAMDDPVVNTLNSLLRSYQFKICSRLLESTHYMNSLMEVILDGKVEGVVPNEEKGTEAVNGAGEGEEPPTEGKAGGSSSPPLPQSEAPNGVSSGKAGTSGEEEAGTSSPSSKPSAEDSSASPAADTASSSSASTSEKSAGEGEKENAPAEANSISAVSRTPPTGKREDALLCLDELVRMTKQLGGLGIKMKTTLLGVGAKNKKHFLEIAPVVLRDPYCTRAEILSICEIINFLCTVDVGYLRKYLSAPANVPPSRVHLMEKVKTSEEAASPENATPDAPHYPKALPGCSHHHLRVSDRTLPFHESMNVLVCLIVHLVDGSDEGVQSQVEAIIHSISETDFTGMADNFLQEFLCVLYDTYWSYLSLPFDEEPATLPVHIPAKSDFKASEYRCEAGERTGAEARQFILEMADKRAQEALVTYRRDSAGRRNAKLIVCRLMSYGIRAHSFRAKYCVMHINFVLRVARVLYYPSRDLAIAALDMYRALLDSTDSFYERYLAKHDLFVPVMDVFLRNPSANNLVHSSIIQMLSFIKNRATSKSVLLRYIVERFGPAWEGLTEPVIADLRHTYQRLHGPKSEEKSSDDSSATQALPPSEQRAREVEKEEQYFESDEETGDQTPEDTTNPQSLAWGGEKQDAEPAAAAENLGSRIDEIQKQAEAEREQKEEEPKWFSAQHKSAAKPMKPKTKGIHISLKTNLSPEAKVAADSAGKSDDGGSRFLNALGVGNSPRPGKSLPRTPEPTDSSEASDKQQGQEEVDIFSSEEPQAGNNSNGSDTSSLGKRSSPEQQEEGSKRQRVSDV